MADKTGIEWTDASWNPIVGCSIVSPGCTNCYAMHQAARIERMAAGSGRATHYAGTTKGSKAGAVWTGRMALAPDAILTQPLRWKRPRRIFVNSMGDLFHEDVPDAWIDRVFAVMALAHQHTFQILTKRSARMRAYVPAAEQRLGRSPNVRIASPTQYLSARRIGDHKVWPLPNVWLGVSAEDQRRADERIPDLLATPAAIRFVSAEPLLGPVDLGHMQEYLPDNVWLTWLDGLDWIIVGGESGRNARPMHPAWARAIRDQCTAAGTAFFFKQWGAWSYSEIGSDGALCPPLPADTCARWRRWDGITFRAAGKGESAAAFLAPGCIAAPANKARAGRLLDGVTHNAMPEVAP